MSSVSRPTVLLTVRGTAIPDDRDIARKVHNETAGSDEGIAAARALGDLSHKVYTPVTGAPGAEENELLFLDVWKDAAGIGTFFSDVHVQQGADMLFSSREAAVWMPAEGAFGFELSAPMHLRDRYLGVARGPIDDPQTAIDAFRATQEPNLSDARRLGQLSHGLFIRMPMPDEDGPLEVLGLDVWANAEGMKTHYAAMAGFEAAFSGEPQTSIWEQPTNGTWTEW